jgi:hypothetical protein
MSSNFARMLLVGLVVTAAMRCPAQITPAEKFAAAPTPATDAEIQRWVDELGHDSYPLRQQAADRLLAAGSAARPSLVKLADGSDPETRAAARRLLSLIDRSEFQRRLEAFAADTDGRAGLTMPGWEAYQELVGGDADDRALFVEMQKGEAPLLAAVFDKSKRPPEDLLESRLRTQVSLLESRLQRVTQFQPNMVNGMLAPSLGSSAAMLFLGSIAETEPSDSVTGGLSHLLQRPPLREQLQRKKGQNVPNAVRRLAVAWALKCPNKSEGSLNARLMAIGVLGLEDALALPLAIVAGGPEYVQLSPAIKAQATITVGQLGNRSHVAQVEPLLNDATIYMTASQENLPGAPVGTVQVRDVAMVVLLRLTDQSPADYGYVAAQQFQPRNFSIQPFGVDGDKRRAQAIAKWRQWRADHTDDKGDSKNGRGAE